MTVLGIGLVLASVAMAGLILHSFGSDQDKEQNIRDDNDIDWDL